MALPFITTALEGGDGSVSRPGSSLPPGKTRYPLYRGLCRPQGRFGKVRKISPPPGFDPGTVQSVASRYTNYATRPHNEVMHYPKLHCACVQLRSQITLSLKKVICRLLVYSPCIFPARVLDMYVVTRNEVSLLQTYSQWPNWKNCCEILLFPLPLVTLDTQRILFCDNTAHSALPLLNCVLTLIIKHFFFRVVSKLVGLILTSFVAVSTKKWKPLMCVFCIASFIPIWRFSP
jgi:hypothetical protein